MLSIYKVKSAKVAGNYFEKDDYYAKDDPEAKRESQWFGKAAATLKLSGPVDKAQFVQLLAGKLPNGTQLGRITQDGIQHAPGWDLTFSAPKSVSVMVELGGDLRLKAAHEKAVKYALGFLEKQALLSRVSIGGVVHPVVTDNLAAALFTHHTSRDQDPQLHTHAVVLNLTQIANGEFRSLETKEVYNQKMFAGLLYRSELAYAAKQLGYDVAMTPKGGYFELTAVPTEVQQEFSQRRQAIEKGLKSSFVKDAKAAERVALNTRTSKKSVGRETLMTDWLSRAKSLSFEAHAAFTHAKARSENMATKPHQKEVMEPDSMALDAVKYATQKLAAREAVFDTDAIRMEAIEHSLGGISLAHVDQAIQHWESEGHLIPAKLDGIQGWTTRRAIFLEKAIISIMKAGQQQSAPIYMRDSIEEKFRDVGFRDGQYEAATTILSTTDRISAVQGFAGTGKTFMLDYVQQYAEKHGVEVRGFAPSATAAKELRDKAGIQSQTLATHLLKNKSLLESGNKAKVDHSLQLWVVDEASMVSSQDMYELLKLSELTHARVVLIGDKQQLPAVEAGKPFALLQKAGMQTTVMKDIVRQKTAQALRAVLNSIDGKIRAAIDILSGRVMEVSGTKERIRSIAEHYLSFSEAERQETIVLAPANKDREELNTLIRKGLQSKGVIQSAEKTVSIYQKLGFTPVEKTRVTNYEEEMVVRFSKAYSSLGVEKDEHAIITGIDEQINRLSAETLSGKNIQWNPAKIGAGRRGGIEVYKTDSRELAVGDMIRWTSNNKSLGVHNSETAQVVSIDDQKIQVKAGSAKADDKGMVLTLNTNDPMHRHFEYAYASTVYAAQGKTATAIIMNSDHCRKFLANQKTFYTGLSRAEKDMLIYVSNKQKYVEAVKNNLGDKTSALESLLGVQNIAKNQNTIQKLQNKSEMEKNKHQSQSKVAEKSRSSSKAENEIKEKAQKEKTRKPGKNILKQLIERNINKDIIQSR